MRKIVSKRFYTASGETEAFVYKSVLNKDGTISVDVIGKESIQDKINSHADSCSIELLMRRCAGGDYSGLSVHQGAYVDVTQMPRTHAEVLQAVLDGRALFDSLPVDVKDAFGNDFNRWFATTGTKDWFGKMGISNKDFVSVDKPVDKSDVMPKEVVEK